MATALNQSPPEILQKAKSYIKNLYFLYHYYLYSLLVKQKLYANNRILHIYLHLCLLKQVPSKPLSHLMQIFVFVYAQFLVFYG